MTIWNKYKKIEEISSKGNIKTYKAKIEPIIKEIIPNNKKEYDNILYNLQNYKDSIYEIIEENNKIYVVLLNDNINLENINIIKEGYKDNNIPITKNEINELFLKEKAMCKIISDNIENNSKVYGTGFFIKLNDNKYGLLTNNHIINNIDIGNTIHFYYLTEYKKIEITKDREVFTNEELDYTFIEIFKKDNIKDYFKLYSDDVSKLKINDIFILQYPKSNEISFSYGKIKLIGNNKIRYNASPTYGSSGSPIILRCNDNLIIGIHHSGYIYKDDNIGTIFNSILFDIQQKNNKIYKSMNINQKSNNLLNNINKNDKNKNEINCIYNKKNKKAIDLLHHFEENISSWKDENKKLYEEGKKNINENNIEIYINNKKIKFNYKYESNEIGQIKVKFKFNKLLTSTSYMFRECSSLESIDLSSFYTNNVTNMRSMFNGCSSLKSIDLSSFNTNNVTNMDGMFMNCSSLKSIDLSSFYTNNVTCMSFMFNGCSSLKSIDLSSFNTNNVTDMGGMFYGCCYLKSIDLSSFYTNNVTNMRSMFCRCCYLESIDLSSFNTNNVTDMDGMFYYCSSLKSIDLSSSFNTNNVTNMCAMFSGCSSLKSIDLSSFNTNNVNNMDSMFYKCSSLKSIDLSSFNTNNVTCMSFMFYGCSSLESIDLSSFNTNNVTNMGGMLYGCSSLKKENVKINKNDKKIKNELQLTCHIF